MRQGMSESKIRSPKAWYQAVCEHPDIAFNVSQAAVVDQLEMLWRELIEFKNRRGRLLGRSLFSPQVPKGLYIWGEVGRGKTFLMDGFYDCLPYRRKRRLHFHEFMLEVHREVQSLAHQADPLMALADKIGRSTRLLCLDEFHVADIVDAMILRRLLAALFERGVVLLITSNYAPDDLYSNGLQRQNFVPAIEALKSELRVLSLDGDSDYRMLQKARTPWLMQAQKPMTEAQMLVCYQRLAAEGYAEATSVQVRQSEIKAKCVAREAVWFDFAVLCGGFHDQAVYLELAHRYPILFLSNVPQLSFENGAEARRFTWLIDVLYDNRVKLIATFETELDALFGTGLPVSETQRIASRLAEMQTPHYLESIPYGQGASLPDSMADSR